MNKKITFYEKTVCCGFDIKKLNEILNVSIDINRDISSCTGNEKCTTA